MAGFGEDELDIGHFKPQESENLTINDAKERTTPAVTGEEKKRPFVHIKYI